MSESDRPHLQLRHADKPLTLAEKAVEVLLTAAHVLAAQLSDFAGRARACRRRAWLP